MKPYVQIALSTGHVFEVATETIAAHRAKIMLELHPSEFADLDASLADTREVFDDALEVRDWALNNMRPEEYVSSARLVRFVPPEQDFNTAEWSFHDHNAIMGELDGDKIMRQPVEAVLSTLAAANQLCNVTVLNGVDGKPFAMMSLVIGNENVIGAFVTALRFTADKVAGAAGITPQPLN